MGLQFSRFSAQNGATEDNNDNLYSPRLTTRLYLTIENTRELNYQYIGLQQIQSACTAT